MKIAFFNNSINHHQVYLADELYKILGNDYVYIVTLPHNRIDLKGGEDYSSRPYCILAGDSKESHFKALQLAREADTCIFGACSQEYAVERAKQPDSKLAFEVAERWLKHGWLTIGSPVFRRWLKNYFLYYRRKPFYKLCSSAFAAGDDEKMHVYVGRHFRWAYFSGYSGIVNVIPNKSRDIRIMWCARFMKYKHPELPIKMSNLLKQKNFHFTLDYYGTGEEEKKTKKLADKLGLSDIVTFHGALPNKHILNAMKEHDILLFTSDKREGWGCVVNEAMSCGCCVVGGDEIGAIPYLVLHKINGMIYKSCSLESLVSSVEWLLTHTEELYEMRKNAKETITRIWSAKNAAENLLKLIDDLYNNRSCSVKEGPASIAPII